MKRWLLLATALLFTAANSAQIETFRDSLCKRLPEGNVCARSTENIFGAPPKNSVLEASGALTITIKNGSKMRWDGGVGEGAPSYSAAYIPRYRFFLVYGVHYEGQSSEWVSYETGESFRFAGPPYLSPDNRFLLVKDTPNHAYAEFIKIYSISTNKITEVAHFDTTRLPRDPNEKEIGDAIWVTSEEIAIFSFYDPSKTPRTYLLARIKKKGDRWILVLEGRK